MKDFDIFLEIYFLFIYTFSQIVLLIWASKGKPEKKIISKYKITTLFLSSLPLGSRWQKQIVKEDIALFKKFFF